jgi:hypothetical protein
MSKFGEAVDIIGEGYPVIWKALVTCNVFVESVLSNAPIGHLREAAPIVKKSLDEANKYIEFNPDS